MKMPRDFRAETDDQLGEATSFVKAIRMCSETMDNAEGCAIALLAEQIGMRLKEAHSIFDDMRRDV